MLRQSRKYQTRMEVINRYKRASLLQERFLALDRERKDQLTAQKDEMELVTGEEGKGGSLLSLSPSLSLSLNLSLSLYLSLNLSLSPSLFSSLSLSFSLPLSHENTHILSLTL
jgi:hypothetical protein